MKLHLKKTILLFFILSQINYAFSQKAITDSLYIEFNKYENDSVRVSILVNITQNLFDNSNDTLLKFYNKHENFIKEKGTFNQKIKSNSIIGFFGHRTGNYKLSLKKFNENLDYSILKKDTLMIAASYGNIGNTYLYKGENKTAIEYYNKALIIFEKNNNIRGLASLYGVLGNTYLKMNKPKVAIENYEKSKTYFNDLKSEFGVATCDMNIGIAYKNLKEYEKALNYFKNAKSVFSKIKFKKGLSEIYGNMGKVNFLLKDYKKALTYYEKTLEISKKLKLNKNIIMTLNWLSECNISMKNYNKAINYSISAIDTIEKYSYENLKKTAYFNLYEANKNKRNYKSALEYFELYKNKTDSVFISEKEENIEKILTEFETREKEKEIQILNINSEKQRNEIKAKQQERNLWLGLSILAIIIGGISIYFFLNKKKLSEELAEKNKIIKKALEDKDVLLREIHHRVKNNLQIISSLLNMQSRYLSDDKSKEIVNESKNRIKSMSLIHQKLYQEENLTGIETKTYFKELIDSLITSYGINNETVKVDIKIENLLLDVDTAIPLGLILNEIISNSFKYGVDKENGEFKFNFKQNNNDELLLTVKDNGNGIPEDFDITKSKSYGMKLIKSLSKKLKADIEFKNNNGLEVIMKIHNFKASKKATNSHDKNQT